MAAVVEIASDGGALFFDIGGHIGAYAMACCRGGGSSVDVFEPLTSNARLIVETAKGNGV